MAVSNPPPGAHGRVLASMAVAGGSGQLLPLHLFAVIFLGFGTRVPIEVFAGAFNATCGVCVLAALTLASRV